MAASEVEKPLKEKELECLRGDQEGILNFADFLPVELTWINIDFFIHLQQLPMSMLAMCISCVFGTAQTAFQ